MKLIIPYLEKELINFKNFSFYMKKPNLGEFEELVLLTIAVLEQKANGVQVTQEINETPRRESLSYFSNGRSDKEARRPQ